MLHVRYLGSFHHKNINRFGVYNNNYCFFLKIKNKKNQVMAVVYVLTHTAVTMKTLNILIPS